MGNALETSARNGGGDRNMTTGPRLLVLVESAPGKDAAEMAHSVGTGAEAAGAELRLRELADADLQDVNWADAMVLVGDGQDMAFPRECKLWLDRLGFSAWRILHGKLACVSAAAAPSSRDADSACGQAAEILRARGMHALTAEQVHILPYAVQEGEWAALGRALVFRCVERYSPHPLAREAGETTA